MKFRIFLVYFIAILEWLALGAQLYLILQNNEVSAAENITRYFSFFTILSNLLVAIMFTSLILNPDGYFSKPEVQSAITLYIFITGVVYSLVLRQAWLTYDLQLVVHEILHSLLPVLCVLYWWKYVNGKQLKYSNVPAWLVFPLVYAIYTLIRGTFTSWYPYPFMNVDKIGYPKTFQNSGVVVIAFVVTALMVVWVGNRKPGGRAV